MGDLLEIPITNSDPAPADHTVTPLVVKNSPSPDQSPSPEPPNTTIDIVSSPANQPPKSSIAIPNVMEMEKVLQESGKLLNEIGINQEQKVDTSPLAALQPQNMLLTKTGPQPIHLPSENEMPLLGINLANSEEGRHSTVNFKGIGYLLIKWGLILLYATLGMFSLLKAIKFFFYEYPVLEKSQALVLETENSTNMILILNLVVLIAAVVLFGLAIKILLLKTLSFSFLGLSLFIATICIVAQTQVNALNASNLNSAASQASTNGKTALTGLLNLVPFLKIQEDGTVTPVWFKDVTEPY